MYFSFAWKMTTRLIKSVKWGNVAPIILCLMFIKRNITPNRLMITFGTRMPTTVVLLLIKMIYVGFAVFRN